ncbi:MAG: hypothetical protein ACFFB3_03965 [Candidatus Hodarchaeota archaeon]
MTLKNDGSSEIMKLLRNVIKTQADLSEKISAITKRIDEQSKLLKKLAKSSEGVPASLSDSNFKSSGPFLDNAFKRGEIPEKAKETFESICKLQKELGRAVRVEDVDKSDLTKSKRPTLYEHVRKLEAANLLTSKIGSEIGLSGADTPPNARYYTVTMHSLYDVSVLTHLPEDLSKTAQKMIALQEGTEKRLSLKEIAKATQRTEQAEKLILEQLYLRNLIEKIESDEPEYYIPRRE